MSGHVDLEHLARFAEGALGEAESQPIRRHLAQCRSCLAAYADAVRYRSAWLVDPQSFQLADTDRGHIGVAPAPPRRRVVRGSARYLVVAGACAAGVLLAWLPRGDDAPAARFTLTGEVLGALSHPSPRSLVLPGVADHATRTKPERRSGPASETKRLEQELEAVVAAYERGPVDANLSSRLIAALLANGENETALEYAHEALEKHPSSVPLLVFAAEARLRAHDPAGAEALLARAARRAPRDPLVALDLGLVLKTTGRTAEARAALERAERGKNAAIAERARRELAQVR